MLFTVTEEMHTWAVKPKQHCTRDGEGVNLFLLNTMVAWRELKTALRCLITFVRGCRLFCGGSEKNVFNGSTKSSFKIFLNFTYEEEFTVSLISF